MPAELVNTSSVESLSPSLLKGSVFFFWLGKRRDHFSEDSEVNCVDRNSLEQRIMLKEQGKLSHMTRP